MKHLLYKSRWYTTWRATVNPIISLGAVSEYKVIINPNCHFEKKRIRKDAKTQDNTLALL